MGTPQHEDGEPHDASGHWQETQTVSGIRLMTNQKV